MSNPFDGLITTAMKTQFKQAINEVIRGCQVPCRLYFPTTKYTQCTSCTAPISSNSPNPFLAGNKGKLTTSCPVCGGSQQIPVEDYIDLDLCVIFDKKKFRTIGDGIVMVPDGTVETFSKIDTITSIKSCKYAIFNTDVEYINKNQYKRSSEPQQQGFGESSYIVTLWEIAG